MDSQPLGIDKWIAGIRSRMANDPGRQDLDDHILCNGFLFLDEYLEDILMGARTEPIIELTKTPGRRKDASKKVRSATTAAMKITPLVLKSPDKENTPVTKSPTVKKAPISFQKALLKASKENIRPDSEDGIVNVNKPARPEPRGLFGRAIQPRDEDEQDEEAVNILITPPLVRVVSGSHVEEIVEPPLLSPSARRPAEPSEVADSDALESDRPGPELSTIPEADEAEMSRVSSTASRPTALIIRAKEIVYPVPEDLSDPNGPMATVTVSYDPNAEDDDDTQAFQTPYDRSFNDSEPTSTASSFPIDPYARDYETHELRAMMGSEQPSELAPPQQSPPTQTLVRKASVPVFPSLPAPSPFRKSVHESSGGSSLTNNARPSAVTGNGTRTSWLNKARDVTTKRTSVVSGVKRKSVELASEPSSATLDNDYTRAKKVAKTTAEGDASSEKPQNRVPIQPFRPTVPAKPREPHFVQATTSVTPEGNSEGMMNILKRTVEGLGARVGKSMGKSLGGAAATAAAAEAKAAAEARLAQREAKTSDENRHGRLSVSDLIGVYDSGKGKGKERELIEPSGGASPSLNPPTVPESRTSISTTPPNSPPEIRDSPSLVPATTTNIIPKFTVQRPLVPEPSLTFPESQQSTQSTYVSSIFDTRSSWGPSSQTTDFTASQGFDQPEAQAKELSLTRESGLSKEVGWTQDQLDQSMVYSKAIDISQEHHATVMQSQVVQNKVYSQVPGAFEPEDEDMVLGDDALYGVDVESENEPMEESGRSTSSPPSDAGTMKSKEGSSQPSSQTGFVAQASGILSKVMGTSVGSALGTSKRGKAEPVKSIQLAAAAAKKQQEEADRKAARLREMDKRRAAIASKKAEQEAADKAKQQGERRKREREEGQEKKITRAAVKKVDEEVVKKRKVVVEIERKPEGKKPASKDQKDLGGSRIGKPMQHAPQMQSGASTLSKSFKQPGQPASASQSTVKLVGSNQGDPRATPGLLKSKDKMTANNLEDVRQPVQTLHAQMQARVQEQLFQARQNEPLIPSESIELPDINSEYSNSDDEDRPRTFNPPDWAQSPDLRLALESQSRMNPDDIFGPVRPLRMEEIFPTRQSRFRARTSSANWAGTDEVTRAEEAQYAKRMGYLD